MWAEHVNPDTWEPGVPLYSTGQHSYSLYVFNFRDDASGVRCACPDRAEWPEPTSHRLSEGDELGDFIRECHAWRAQEVAS